EQLLCIFVDTGLLRHREGDEVMALFAEHLGARVERIDARDQFMQALAGVSDPEEKRKIIDHERIEAVNSAGGRPREAGWPRLGPRGSSASMRATSSCRPWPASATRKKNARSSAMNSWRCSTPPPAATGKPAGWPKAPFIPTSLNPARAGKAAPSSHTTTLAACPTTCSLGSSSRCASCSRTKSDRSD